MTTRILFIICLVSARAYGDPKLDAKQHVDRATVAHAAGHFDEALNELTLAYALDPDPELLYAIGQVHAKLGDCDSATTFYKRFLATKPDAKETAVAQKAITTCKPHPRPVETTPKPAEPPPPPVEPPPPPAKVEPPPVVQAPPVELPRPQARPWYRDGFGDAFVVAGIAASAVGGFEYRAALTSRDAANSANNYGDYIRHTNDLGSQRIYAVAFGGSGVLLVGIGIIHYLVAHDDAPEHLAVVPTRGGSVLSWSTRF